MTRFFLHTSTARVKIRQCVINTYVSIKQFRIHLFFLYYAEFGPLNKKLCKKEAAEGTSYLYAEVVPGTRTRACSPQYSPGGHVNFLTLDSRTSPTGFYNEIVN